LEPEPARARFVTRAELDRVGLGHLVGTPLLRAFMHGFFLHNRLWHKALALAAPFAYDDYRAARVAAKLEAERQSRITVVRKLPKARAPRAWRFLSCAELDGKGSSLPAGVGSLHGKDALSGGAGRLQVDAI